MYIAMYLSACVKETIQAVSLSSPWSYDNGMMFEYVCVGGTIDTLDFA